MKLKEKVSKLCIKVSDWFAHPLSIFIFPIICIIYIVGGGTENRLTLILSILAISLTQMVLNAQNVDSEANKLQIAELIHTSPTARDKVIDKNLTEEEIKEMEEEIQRDATK